MFNTKNLVCSVKDVPVVWVFEHFCKLNVKLEGNDVKIKSLFKDEKTPSMCIYLDGKSKQYKFKDFSSGKGGSHVDLVRELFSLDYHQACMFIIEQYNDFVLHNNKGYDVEEFKKYSKYKVTSHELRSWTTKDAAFWTKFNIGSDLLKQYNVKPLLSYKMQKDDDAGHKELTITGHNIYGYFKKDGTLYKVYQPKTSTHKFIKVCGYIQGLDQLEKRPYLLITSSLKDVMAIKSLGIKMDVIAPDSENTMIRKEVMEKFIEDYKKVIIIFDNDAAGILSMTKYKQLYPAVEISILAMSKDISDSIKDFGAKQVRNKLVPLINKKIENV